MQDDEREIYAAEWGAATRRQRTEILQLEALAWDTDAALAGNPVAAASLPRYGRERTLRRLIATAMQHQQQQQKS
jgi:hypothetical protein